MAARRSGTPSQRGKGDRVLTPGGWRSSSQVRFVPPGYEVSGAGGRLRIVNRTTGEVLEDLGAIGKTRRVSKAARRTRRTPPRKR